MDGLAQKLIAKILIIPAIFSFALACCHPLFAQAAEPTDGHVQIQEEISVAPAGLIIQESHQCDHAAHHEQIVAQTVNQKIVSDLAFTNSSLSAAAFYQYPTVYSSFITFPRITGPPWDGKSIKAFLGVYRS